MNERDEYLKRNLDVCKAYGAKAGIEAVMRRMQARQDCPKWLIDQLQECLNRVAPLIPALVAHRAEVSGGESLMPPNTRNQPDKPR